MRGQAFTSIPIILAALALAGCASTQADSSSRMFGLRPGPMPSPQPFVVESRASAPQGFPAMGAVPPPRRDRVLSVDERKALENDLKRYQNRTAARTTVRKPKKPQPQG